MQTGFWTTFGASLIAAAVTTAGLGVIRRFEPWARANTTYFACFAAGVLISVSLLHLIPSAIEMHPQGPTFVLIGYLSMHFINRFIAARVCDKAGAEHYAIGLIPLVGIGFHSLLDGVVYSITFSVDFFTGVLAALGMVLHEFPEGIVTYTLLLAGGFGRQRALILAFLAAALTTPLGTLLSYPWVSRIDTPVLGILLGLSAGALLYVGATHLLGHAEREPRRFSLAALMAGILVALGILFSKG